MCRPLTPFPRNGVCFHAEFITKLDKDNHNYNACIYTRFTCRKGSRCHVADDQWENMFNTFKVMKMIHYTCYGKKKLYLLTFVQTPSKVEEFGWYLESHCHRTMHGVFSSLLSLYDIWCVLMISWSVTSMKPHEQCSDQ